MEYEPIVPLPPKDELSKLAQKYIDELSKRSRYDDEDEAIVWLFKKFKENGPKSFNKVLIKVMALDSSYSTNLRNFNLILSIVKKITTIPHFNNKIKERDLSLVDKLCSNGNKSEAEEVGKPFSFASKYCCIQNIALKEGDAKEVEQYAIYDSFVAKVLTWYQEKRDFLSKNGKEDCQKIWKSHSYKNQYKVDALKTSYETLYFPVVLCFQYYCNLTHFTLRDLDHFLWRMGQEYFLGYKIAKFSDYIIKLKGKETLNVTIYKLCSSNLSEELNNVSRTIKYAKKNYGRKENEEDIDYALRLLKEFYVCVMRKEGVVGDYYIVVDEKSKSVNLYHTIYSPTLKFSGTNLTEEGNHKNGKEELAKTLMEKAIKEGYKIAKESLQDVCKELVEQYHNKLSEKIDYMTSNDIPISKANTSKQNENSNKNK